MASDSFQAFFANVPLLHSWDNGQTWNRGGFLPKTLRALKEVIEPSLEPGVSFAAETGAGNSSILFLLMKPRALYSIAPEAALRDRILAYCTQNNIDSAPLHYEVARSEVFLPKLAEQFQAEKKKLDVALIDGGHGWPTVFIDFCYFNSILKKGGLLVVDDLQLYSINEFARWLSMQPEYSLVKDLEKTLVFRKEVAAEYFPDFGSQPYIKQRNAIMKESANPYSLKQD